MGVCVLNNYWMEKALTKYVNIKLNEKKNYFCRKWKLFKRLNHLILKKILIITFALMLWFEREIPFQNGTLFLDDFNFASNQRELWPINRMNRYQFLFSQFESAEFISTKININWFFSSSQLKQNDGKVKQQNYRSRFSSPQWLNFARPFSNTVNNRRRNSVPNCIARYFDLWDFRLISDRWFGQC